MSSFSFRDRQLYYRLARHLDPIRKLVPLPRGQPVNQFPPGDVAAEARRVGDAAPGLEADEGAAGLGRGPKAEGLGLGTADGKDGPAGFVDQGGRCDLRSLDEECVGGESVVGKGQTAARRGQGPVIRLLSLSKHPDRFVKRHPESIDQVVPQHRIHKPAIGIMALDVAVDGVGGVVVGKVERGMRADLEVQVASVAVFHRPGAIEALPFHMVAHRESVLERIVPAAAVACHHESTAGRPFDRLRERDELRVAGEAVLLHRVRLPIDPEKVSGHLADDRKKNRSASSPIGRIALPKVLASFEADALQFRPMV